MFPFIWHDESFVEGELLSCLSLSLSLHSCRQNHSILFCSTNLLRSHNVPETVLVLIISFLPFCTLTCPHTHTHEHMHTNTVKVSELKRQIPRGEALIVSLAPSDLDSSGHLPSSRLPGGPGIAPAVTPAHPISVPCQGSPTAQLPLTPAHECWHRVFTPLTVAHWSDPVSLPCTTLSAQALE